MAKRLKVDDLVQVITGKDKGKQGKVIALDHLKSTVIVDGINISKLHKKKTDKIEGGIIEAPRPIHQSNVAVVCPEKKVSTKIGFKTIKDGKKRRFSKVSGATF